MMDCLNQTIDKENLFISLLHSIFNKEASVGTSHGFGKYQVTIQEFSPIQIKQCSLLFPLKSLILQQLPECENIHVLQNSSNKFTDSNNLDGTIEWTGCPLEASFDQIIHETSYDTVNICTSTNSNMKPKSLPLTTARLFSSLYNIHFGGQKNENILPLWIPCSLNNLEHVSWIGTYCRGHTNNRAIITTSGPSFGKYLPSFDDIKKKHFVGHSTDFLKTATEVFASYNLADNIDMRSCTSAQSDCVKRIPVTIECFSNKPTHTLDILDEDAKCNILLKINSDADSSSHYVVCKDLELIKMLASRIESNAVIWPPKLPDYDVYNEINTFMEGLKYRSFQKADVKNLSSTNTCHMESPLLGTRQELDFTDELWNVLKRCSSYEELQNSLDYIIQVLKMGEVQPVIFRNNNTNIGKMARTLQQSGSEIDLKGKSAFNDLIEIGLEKLRRDFMYIFIEYELATQSQLSPFLKTDLPFTKSILQLTKLHNVLKIVSTCKTDLQLPSTTIKLFAREALTYYCEMESEDIDHIFEFSVPQTSIRKVINNLKASQWQISLKTETSSYSSHTICYLSLTDSMQSDQNHKDSDSLTPPFSHSYYCTVARFLQDFIY